MNKNTPTEKQDLIAPHVEAILKILGADMKDSNFKETPKRVAKMFVQEIFGKLSGYKARPKLTTFPRPKELGVYDQMVVVKNITINSTCAHHLLPFYGVVHIAYFPTEFVLGLSKFNRLVDFHSSQPQVQENLTQSIATDLQKLLETEHVAVVIDCVHLCTKVRGIKDLNSSTRTLFVGGQFRDGVVKQEFLTQIQ